MKKVQLAIILILSLFILSCSFMNKDENKEYVYYIEGTTQYHKVNCTQLLGQKYKFLTKEAAEKLKYTPCPTCNP